MPAVSDLFRAGTYEGASFGHRHPWVAGSVIVGIGVPAYIALSAVRLVISIIEWCGCWAIYRLNGKP